MSMTVSSVSLAGANAGRYPFGIPLAGNDWPVDTATITY
jgi:hypothetical protein